MNDFASTVHDHIYVSEDMEVNRQKAIALASKCNVAPSTVLRWAAGHATPSEHVQAFVRETLTLMVLVLDVIE